MFNSVDFGRKAFHNKKYNNADDFRVCCFPVKYSNDKTYN